MNIVSLAISFERHKFLFGLHLSTPDKPTDTNSRFEKVRLWCHPNTELMTNVNFAAVFESKEILFA